MLSNSTQKNAFNLLGSRTICFPWIYWVFALSLVEGWGWSDLVARRGPDSAVCGSGTAWSQTLGLSGTGWRRAGREGTRGFLVPRRARPSSRTPCWHPRMPWWRSAAPADRVETCNWEQSGKMACSSESPCEGRREGSEHEEKRDRCSKCVQSGICFFLVGNTHLYWKTWRVSAAGACAVRSSLKGGGAGALRGQGQVMIDPLTPLHQQMR